MDVDDFKRAKFKMPGVNSVESDQEIPEEIVQALLEELVELGYLYKDDNGEFNINPDKVDPAEKLAFSFETDEEGDIISMKAVEISDLPPGMIEQ